jgi:hypothetical protein
VDLKSLSLPQRLLAGAGCVVVLAVIAAAALYIYLDRRAARDIAADLTSAGPGWADSLRAAGRLPDFGDLAAARTDSADGAWVVYDTARAYRREGVEHAYRAIVGSDVATATDSAVWRALARDTSLDAWASAARAMRWDATDRLLANARPGMRPNIMLLPIPHYVPARTAARALVIRGLVRLDRRDLVGARADLAAATGLGAQMTRREPVYFGTLVGRTILASGLTGWLRYAALTRDTALATRVTGLRDWAVARPAASRALMAAPDTAFAIAADTTLTLGVRTYGLEQLLAVWVVRPRGLIFGPPRSVVRRMDRLAEDADPDMAAMARLAAGTARRLNLFGLRGLLSDRGP